MTTLGISGRIVGLLALLGGADVGWWRYTDADRTALLSGRGTLDSLLASGAAVLLQGMLTWLTVVVIAVALDAVAQQTTGRRGRLSACCA